MFLIFLFTFLRFSNASRILFVAPTPSYSHQIVFQPIWRELSSRGHQVTVITPNPLKDPKLTNLTEIGLEYVYSVAEKKYKFSETLNKVKDEPLKFASFLVRVLSQINEDELSDPGVRKIIENPDEEFDLVIVEFLLPTMLAFGYRFKCPVIAVTSLDGSLLGQDAMGNPSHPALNPDSLLKFNVPLTFPQRIFSTVYSILRRVSYIVVRNREDEIIEEYFGPGYPRLEEMMENIDMFFMNVNPAFHNVRPTVPAVVNIGGSMAIQQPKALPEELQNFLDHAEDGVIYFSMGTNIKTKNLSKKFSTEISKAFSELPYKVLLKLDDPDLDGKTHDMFIVNWVQQQDVLRHRNVKAFITQGGLQSLEEAIYFKKPVVCIPHFGDQYSNCIQAYNKGIGLMLEYENIDFENVKRAVYEVVENRTYSDKIAYLADIAVDQPMTGLEKSIWWTEYVLRHKGAKHLRSPAVDMPLYQYFLIDVLAFLFATIFTIAYTVVKSLILLFRIIRGYFKTSGNGEVKLKKK